MDLERLRNLVGDDVVNNSPLQTQASVGGFRRYDDPETMPVDESKIPDRDWNIIKEREKALTQIFDTSHKGKYRLELRVMEAKRSKLTWPGELSFWTNDQAVSSSGMARKLYLCPGKLLGRSNCYALLPPEGYGSGFCVCPKCGSKWQSDLVIGETLGNQTPGNWAKTIARHILERFENSVDLIGISVQGASVRGLTEVEQNKRFDGELLEKNEKMWKETRFNHEDMVQATSRGADLRQLIHGFLRHLLPT